MSTNVMSPLFFISHGAPTFAIEPGILGVRLKEIGRSLNGVKAILIVSPHWQTKDVEVMTNARPETIHDFYGFPQALYNLSYPVLGARDFAVQTSGLLQAASYRVKESATRGLDHGAWVPLLHLLPEGEIPVFQVSMPSDLDPLSAFHLGQALAPLRQEGVAIVGSGGITHNLNDFRQGVSGNLPYVEPFAQWVKQAVREDRLDQLFAYRSVAPSAARAHPTEEHFLPLFVALGARLGDSDLLTIEGGIDYGILSMDSFVWGLKPH